MKSWKQKEWESQWVLIQKYESTWKQLELAIWKEIVNYNPECFFAVIKFFQMKCKFLQSMNNYSRYETWGNTLYELTPIQMPFDTNLWHLIHFVTHLTPLQPCVYKFLFGFVNKSSNDRFLGQRLLIGDFASKPLPPFPGFLFAFKSREILRMIKIGSFEWLWRFWIFVEWIGRIIGAKETRRKDGKEENYANSSSIFSHHFSF